MAEEIGVLKIDLSLNAGSFQKQMQDVGRKLKGVQSEFKAAAGGSKEFENSLEGMRAKSDNLANTLTLQKARVNALLSEYKLSAEAKGKDAKESENLLIRYNKAVAYMKKTESALDDVTQAIKRQENPWVVLRNKVQEAGERMQDVGGRMQTAGQEIATSFGAASAAIGAALGLSVKKSMDFEAQLSRVGAIAGSTDEELQALRQSALDLGASTSKSATEIAQGQEALAALGFTTKDILGAMPGVISAAEASGSDMAQTAEVMASTLNIFGLEASKATDVADVLAMTANISAANLTDMQYALKYAGPPASALGVSLEELSASIGIMTNAGMQGEQAGTTFRSALLSLLDPSEENSKMMQRMGITVTDAQGNFVGLAQLVRNLSTSMEGQTETQKAATLASLVGKEAVSGMLSLMQAGPAEIEKMTKALENSGGASAEAATKMKDNLKGAVDELSGSFETMQISIGTALTPAIELLVSGLQKLTDWFNSLSPSTQKFIAISAGIAAVLTGIVAAFGVVLMVVGGAISGLGALTGAIATATGGAGLLSTAIAIITGPIGIAVAAIVGLGAALITAYKHNETFRNAVKEIWNQVKEAFQVSLQFVQNVVQKVMSTVSLYINEKLVQIKKFWTDNGDQIKQATTIVWNVISKAIEVAMNLINGIMKVLWPVIKLLIISTWDAIKGVIDGALNVIMGLIKTFSALFTGDWKGMWEGIKTLLTGAVQLIWNVINLLFIGKILGGIKALATSFLGSTTTMWTGIKTIFSSSINNVRSAFTTGFNYLKSFVSSPISTIVNLITKGFTTIKTFITTTMNSIKTKIVDGWNASVNYLKGIDLVQIGKNIIQGLIKGIGNMIGALQEKVKSIADAVTGTFKKVLDIHSPSRVTEKIGEHTSEGFAKGISKKGKDAEKAAREAAAKAKTGFETAFRNLDYKFDAKKLSATQYVNELEKIKKQYATVPNAIERVDKTIVEVSKKHAKELFEIDKNKYENKMKLGQLDWKQELTILQDLAKKYKKGSEERVFFEEKIYDIKKNIHDKLTTLNEEYAQKTKDVNSKLLEDEKKAQQDYKEKVSQIKEQLKEDKIKALEEYKNKAKEINDNLLAEEKRLNDEYKKTLQDRTNSLYSFTGLFDEIKKKEDVNGKGLLKNLGDQVTSFKDWQSNMKSLTEKGISADLLKELKDMGPQAADEIAALNTLSTEELTQYASLWAEKHKLAKDEATTQLVGMKLETQTQIQQLKTTASLELDQLKLAYKTKVAELTTEANNEIAIHKITWEKTVKELRANASAELTTMKTEWIAKIKELTGDSKKELDVMKSDMKTIGSDSVKGLMAGMKEMEEPLKKQAKAMADAIQKTIQSALKIKSPSRVMMELGKWVPEGLAEGIRGNLNAVVQASNQMAKASIPNGNSSSNVNHINNSRNYQPSITVYGGPSAQEIARMNERALRKLAFEWG